MICAVCLISGSGLYFREKCVMQIKMIINYSLNLIEEIF